MSDLQVQLRRKRNLLFRQLKEKTEKSQVPTREICFEWSQFAIQCLEQAFEEACQQTGLDSQKDLALFAYGKLGAEELNLSSDVDLVLVCQNEDPG